MTRYTLRRLTYADLTSRNGYRDGDKVSERLNSAVAVRIVRVIVGSYVKVISAEMK